MIQQNKSWITPKNTVKACYTRSKVTVREMFKHLKNQISHLRLIQQDEVNKLYIKYSTKNFLSQDERNYLWQLYYNFILNGYRYEKPAVKVDNNQTQSHIAWNILDMMNPDSFITDNTTTQSE